MASLYALLGATAGLLVLDAMTGRSLAVSWPTALRRGLAAMFMLTGASHFIGLREDLIEMVPPALPAPDLLVTLTGVLELVGAAGLLWRPFAAWSAAGLAALLVAMFPANVYAAVSDVQVGGGPATALPLRTGMQVLYVVAAGAVWATHRRRDAAVRAGRSWHPPGPRRARCGHARRGAEPPRGSERRATPAAASVSAERSLSGRNRRNRRNTMQLDGRFRWRGRTVAWTRSGEGPAVVFCHGTPWSSGLWAPFAEALSGHFTVYLWDMPGYGLSSKDPAHAVGLGTQVELFAALLAEWDLREPHVVAHDFGGAVALGAHLLRGRQYASLFLVDVVALSPWGSPFFSLVRQNAEVFSRLPPVVHEGALRGYIRSASHRGLSEDRLSELTAPWLTSDGRPAFYRQIAQADERFTDELRPLLAHVGAPVHIVWGTEDGWIPVDRAVALHRAIPGSTLRLVDGAGHLVHLDQPVALADELRGWLDARVVAPDRPALRSDGRRRRSSPAGAPVLARRGSHEADRSHEETRSSVAGSRVHDGPVIVRRELPRDRGAVRAVHAAAFALPGGGVPAETHLVDALRDDGAVVPGLSLVAELAGEVVGHVLCSRGDIEGRPAVGLGPLGVLPTQQRRGVGQALMHGVLAAADALGEPCVALLGDVGFYARFGFLPAHQVGVRPRDPAWGVHFQVRRLTAWTDDIAGEFHYATAFDHL